MAMKRDLSYQVDGMMVWIAVGLEIVWGVSVLHCKKTVAIYLKLTIISINMYERFKKFECQNLCRSSIIQF